MQLRRIDLVNVRSYESAHVELGPGTTLIVGDVGAGKSSLLYGIEMALFGVAEVDAAYLVRHGALHADVAVRLDDGEHRYDVARRFRRVKRRGREQFETERITFREDGAATSYSATEIRQRVIELLGFPDNPNPQAHSDLWRWAIYVPQERMREILAAAPQDRLETVRKALGVERYRTAAENAQDVAANLRGEARHRREEAERMHHFDEEFAGATEAADRIRTERVGLEARLATAGQGVEAAGRRRDDLRSRASAAAGERALVESLQREQAADRRADEEEQRLRTQRTDTLRTREADVAQARAQAGARPELARRLAAAEAEESRLRLELDRVEEAARTLASLEAEVRAAEQRRTECEDRAVRARQQLETAEQEWASAVAEGPSRLAAPPTPHAVAELEERLSAATRRERDEVERVARARTALSELEELLRAGRCPRCEQPVRPHDFEPHRGEAARALEAAEQGLAAAAQAREEADATKRARERWERTRERWEAAERHRATLAAQRDRLAADRTLAEEARREADRVLAELRARRAARGPVEEERGRLRSAVSAARAAEERLRRDLDAAGDADRRVRSAEEAIASISAELERESAESERRRRRMGERAEQLTTLEGRLAANREVARELEDAERAHAAADRTRQEVADALVRADTRLDAELQRRATAERGRAARAALVVTAGEIERKAEWLSGAFRTQVLRTEQAILAHAQVAFDRAFARYFTALVDDPALVARTDAGFTPEVEIDGSATPAEALSGGERTALALAFRLALASVVRSLGEVRLETLLLDEPTDGFSSEQVMRMGELLEELGLPQVVLVSHEGQLAGIADRALRVVKSDGRSAIEGAPEAAADAAHETLVSPVPSRRRTAARRPKDAD